MQPARPKIVTIVGPTAAGKTSLSIAIATRFNGEVISADSRQVYRGLDLGSGKVTLEEMGDVPHHLLDVADPKDVYTANDFARDAASALTEIIGRNHLPIIAGGTFFYVDMLLGRVNSPEVPPNESLRAELATLDTPVLAARLEALDPDRAATIDRQNPRRLIRAIEIATALGNVPPITDTSDRYDVCMIGIDIPNETLKANIHTRLLERLDDGMVAEVEELLAAGVSEERLEALGLEYRYIGRYLAGNLTYDAMRTELETKIGQFAKRQLTWLKRDPTISWFSPQDHETIFQHVETFLAQ